MKVSVQLVHAAARPPVRATDGAIGYDLRSCEDIIVPIGERRMVDTGVRIAFDKSPPGAPHCEVYARIAPRSGLALRGIDVAAGVCDSDYRGVYKVVLVNNSRDEFAVHAGDRIAQLIFECAARVGELSVVDPGCLSDVCVVESGRGAGGFGSTGAT